MLFLLVVGIVSWNCKSRISFLLPDMYRYTFSFILNLTTALFQKLATFYKWNVKQKDEGMGKWAEEYDPLFSTSHLLKFFSSLSKIIMYVSTLKLVKKAALTLPTLFWNPNYWTGIVIRGRNRHNQIKLFISWSLTYN